MCRVRCLDSRRFSINQPGGKISKHRRNLQGFTYQNGENDTCLQENNISSNGVFSDPMLVCGGVVVIWVLLNGKLPKLIRNPFNPRVGGNPEQSAILLGVEVGNRWPHGTRL